MYKWVTSHGYVKKPEGIFSVNHLTWGTWYWLVVEPYLSEKKSRVFVSWDVIPFPIPSGKLT